MEVVKFSHSSMVEHLFNAASISVELVKAIVIKLLVLRAIYENLKNKIFYKIQMRDSAFAKRALLFRQRPISVGLLTCQGPINQKCPLTCQHTHTFFCDFIIIAYKISRAFFKFILAAHFMFMAAHLPGIIRCTYHYLRKLTPKSKNY